MLVKALTRFGYIFNLLTFYDDQTKAKHIAMDIAMLLNVLVFSHLLHY